MKCSVCNQDHSDQVNDFPVGARVVVRKGGFSYKSLDGREVSIGEGSFGVVISHADDGRAILAFDDSEIPHTFHYPNNYLSLAREREIEYHLESDYGDGIWQFHAADANLKMIEHAKHEKMSEPGCRPREWRIVKVITTRDLVG